MRVATLCGSHHPASTNAAVLGVLAARLEHHGVEAVPLDTEVEVPALRPEAVDEPPAAVADLRRVLDASDGFAAAIPEYAGGLPGWVKNITDWMVGSASLYRRPAVVVSAATSGGANAVGQMARTLTWHGAFVVATLEIAAPLTKVGDDQVVSDAATVGEIERIADVLVDAVAGGVERATVLSTAALTSLGIDPLSRLP